MQRGFTLRDMYLSVGVFVGRGTQEGLKLRNKYLTVGFLVGILKCIISISLKYRFYNVLQCQQSKGPSTKDVRQMGRGVVLKFRTFPDGGRGGGL